MLDVSTMDKYDTQKMYKAYDDWPNIAKEYYEKKFENVTFAGIDHIIFAGMGGSGALGDIFSAILSKTDIHVCVVKGYNLPNTVNSNTLVVAISISGDTDETLRILDLAHNQNCKLIAFTSGGKMEQVCLDKNIEFRKIKEFHSPRASFPSFLYSILNVLSQILPIKKEDVLKSIEQLKSTQKEISSDNLYENNPALSLAKWITGMPLIYYPWGLQSAAIRFKNSLQENSKIHVIIEDIVESCHNGIVAWERKSNVQPILIKGVDDHNKTNEKNKILKEYFQENKIEYREIISIEGDILSKIINFIYILDYCSIYKAVLTETDPTPVKSIKFIKKRLK
jgi:glucose/mannose-6-phosphate isomerase